MAFRDTLKTLLEAAERFEGKTPKYRRIESERQALREAITQAQLVLSVQEASKEQKGQTSQLKMVSGGKVRKKVKSARS
ncbi:hypothetical protein [Nitrospira sp. Nam74]